MLSVVMLSAVMLSVVMLSAVMLSVVMLNVVAPQKQSTNCRKIQRLFKKKNFSYKFLQVSILFKRLSRECYQVEKRYILLSSYCNLYIATYPKAIDYPDAQGPLLYALGLVLNNIMAA